MTFFVSYFSLYHYKIHPVTNYKAIKNKINKTRQHRTFFLTKKTATTATTKHAHIHTHTHTQRKKENEIKLTCSRPPLFSF